MSRVLEIGHLIPGQDTGAPKDPPKNVSKAKVRSRAIALKHKDTPASIAKKAFKCFLQYGMKPLLYVTIAFIWAGRQLYFFSKKLPWNVMQMIFGSALCFFGGTYFISIAAIEAFRNFGGDLLLEELSIMWEQGRLAAAASLQDDTVDDDHDGTPDVQEMTYNQYLTHKTHVCMAAVTDPKGLMNAVQYLLMTYASVLAVLKFQFAKTIALCVSVAEMIELPFVRVFSPLLSYALGPDLHQWVHPIISTTIKIIAVCVATYVQAVISAFYSGLRGGKLFAEGLINILGDRGLLDKCPTCLVTQPFHADESCLDEIIAYPLAAAGFYFQFSHNFSLPFPWDILLLPLTVVEWILRWEVFSPTII